MLKQNGRESSRTIGIFKSSVALATLLAFTSTGLIAQVQDPGPQGAARHWEPAMPVGLYSQVNLNTGRVLTVIPLTGWSGLGPSMQFALYHNMTSPWTAATIPIEPQGGEGGGGAGGGSALIGGDTNEDGQLSAADLDGFADIVISPNQSTEELAIGDFDASDVVDAGDFGSLLETLMVQGGGPQWTHSYSAHLIINANGSVTVVRDDGTKDTFPSNVSGGFNSPKGVFETLTYDAVADRYTLKSKSQMKAVFEPRDSGLPEDGYRLEYIEDPSENRVTCGYYEDRLSFIEDAAYRRLQFEYNEFDKIKRITGPGVSNSHVDYRWDFWYDDDPCIPDSNPCEDGIGPGGSGALREVYFPVSSTRDPQQYRLAFSYTPVWEIASITDKDGYAYDYQYTTGRLTRVIDPINPDSPGDPRLDQEFRYGVYSGALRGTYTDRRQNDWIFATKVLSGNFIWFEDPLGHRRNFYYEQSGPGAILAHEVTKVTDAMNHTWRVEYDNAGNVINTFDPLNSLWSFEYDAGGLNNLVRITPPSDAPAAGNGFKAVTLEYDDSNHPTSPTAIVEPPADQYVGDDEPARTEIEYYNLASSTPFGAGRWNGLVSSVVPPYSSSPVVTTLRYDAFGQPYQEFEGPPLPDPMALAVPPESVVMQTNSDAGGFAKGGSDGVFNSSVSQDGDGNVESVACKEAHSTELQGPGGGEASPLLQCFPPGTSVTGCTQIPIVNYPDGMEAGCTSDIPKYTNMGLLTELNLCVVDVTSQDGSYLRTLRFGYDHLHRMTSSEVESNEPTSAPDVFPRPLIQRTFAYQPDWATGIYQQTGPDGSLTVAQLDAAGRVSAYTRTDAMSAEIVGATLQYYDDDRLYTITYSNGTQTRYIYDAAGRVVGITHETVTPEIILQLEYVWTNDGLVDLINETDANGVETTIDFTYDQRNRLIEEVRYGQAPSPTDYQYRYLYDAAGNRLLKEDVLAGVNTAYTYDISDPATYISQGNRLVESRTYEAGTDETIEKRLYTYDKAGRVKFVVREIAGDVDPENDNNQWIRGTDLTYSTQGKIWLARSTRWQLEEVPDIVGGGTHTEATHFSTLAQMEYRYDGGRQRYMVRPYAGGHAAVEAGQWREYAGSSAFSDYGVTFNQSEAAVVENRVAHEPGIMEYDYTAASGSRQTYLHTNLIGTTEATSGSSPGSPPSAGRAVYSAFGERVYANGVGGGRYGYAGAWGYQQPGTNTCNPPFTDEYFCDPLAELGWLHVGERYYDPSCGRFVQRDPIGIKGGGNTYVYVNGKPPAFVDPDGLGGYFTGGGIKGRIRETPEDSDGPPKFQGPRTEVWPPIPPGWRPRPMPPIYLPKPKPMVKGVGVLICAGTAGAGGSAGGPVAGGAAFVGACMWGWDELLAMNHEINQFLFSAMDIGEWLIE